MNGVQGPAVDSNRRPGTRQAVALPAGHQVHVQVEGLLPSGMLVALDDGQTVRRQSLGQQPGHVAGRGEHPAGDLAWRLDEGADVNAWDHQRVTASSRAAVEERDRVLVPEDDPGRADAYDALYAEYVRLHDYFGRGGNDVMHRLGEIKRTATPR